MGYLLSQTDHPYNQVVITLESSISSETQFFYDTGKGFNENESIRKVAYQENVPVTLYFDFPSMYLYGLRFDPSRSAAKIKIHEIILKYKDKKPFSVPLDSLTAENNIRSLDYDGKTVTIEVTEAAVDPVLLFSQIGPAPRLTPLIIAAWVFFGAAISLVIALLIVWAYRNCMNEKEAVWICDKGNHEQN